jgi:hypothetical protein
MLFLITKSLKTVYFLQNAMFFFFEMKDFEDPGEPQPSRKNVYSFSNHKN